MAGETEQGIARLTEKVFGVQLKTSTPKNNGNGEQKPLDLPVYLPEKRFEIQNVPNGERVERVPHFYTLVPTTYGVVLKFNDAGSRAVRIRTSRYPQEP